MIDERQTCDDCLLRTASLGYSPAMPAAPSGKTVISDAEELAVAALTFVASDPVLMPRFLAMSGIEAAHIRKAAAEPGFLAGVLRFVLGHEPTLSAFCAETGTPPARVSAALRVLPFGDDTFEAST